MSPEPSESPAGREQPFTPLEWALAGLGLAALLGLLGYHLWLALGPRPELGVPEIRVLATTAHPADPALFTIKLEVRNPGNLNLTEVEVAGLLAASPGAPPEEATSIIDYLPAHSTRTLVLSFQHDPASAHLILLPRSYQKE